MLRSRATDTVEPAMATCLGIDVYMTLGQMDRAIATGLDYLRHVAIDWPLHPTEEQVETEYQRICSQLGGRATGPGSIEVAVREGQVTPSDLPQAALHYVIRTQESVLLDDASSDNVYSKDEYVRHGLRRLLDIPGMVFVIKADGQLEFASRRHLEYLGKTQKR